MSLLEFPKNFLWGYATAAYQIEGAVNEDGRGESIWDRFAHTPGKIANGDNGDIACDHYHRYEEDVQLMADLGVNSYRFSLSWSRIFPNGKGAINQKGLDFYKRVLASLQHHNISPAVTLYHWDLPQALQDKGGWGNRDTTDYFEEYSARMFDTLGDIVPVWITHNEPWCVSFLSNWLGIHAPGNRDFKSAVEVSHNLLLSHGKSVRAFRQSGRKGEIGITLNFYPTYPATDREEDVLASARYDGHFNRWFADPVLKGSYPADIVEYYRTKELLHTFPDDDLRIISQPVDFLGVNYYSSNLLRHDTSQQPLETAIVSRDLPKTAMNWEIHPEGLYDLLTRLRRDYGDIKIMITENGSAYDDVITDNGEILDQLRIDYLRDHYAQTYHAIQSGVNVTGYYVWTLYDNFEWAEGFSKRFGLVYIDYKTQKRIPKLSAKWNRDVMRKNGFEY
ncbi:MAG TPA: GH1 family beta-glucosidase [Spirochaetota bacterium]